MKARKSAKIIMRKEEEMMRASEVEPNTGWLPGSDWARSRSSAGEAGRAGSGLATRITVAGLERPSWL